MTLTTDTASFTAVIGDGSRAAADVDLFAVQLAGGSRLTIDVDARSLASPSTLDSFLRVFDATGRQLATNDDSGGSLDSLLTYTPAAGGTYYVGVSSYGNSAYDPRTAGSATAGRTTGDYTVRFTVAEVVPPLTADIVDVTPDPRTTAVDGITIGFNRAVTGFDLADLRLVRSGTTVSLSGASLVSDDGGLTWTLTGIAPATTSSGSYTLSIVALGSGVVDAAGRPLAASASDSWTTTVASIVDVGDSTTTAQVVAIAGGEARISGRIGDGRFGPRDVDIYAVTLAAGQTLVIDVDARSLSGGSTLDSFVRLFDATRRQVAANDDSGGSLDSYLAFTARAAGTYYVGVSGYGNSAYNPAVAGSGRSGSTGVYQVALRLQSASGARSLPPGMVRVLGFRDEPAVVPTATFAALGSSAAALPAAIGIPSRKR